MSIDLRKECNRLARFGAKLLECHSSCVYLPLGGVSWLPSATVESASPLLELAASYSEGTDLVHNMRFCPESTCLRPVVIDSKVVLLTPDTPGFRQLSIYSQDIDVITAAAVPLASPTSRGEKGLGVWYFDRTVGAKFQKRDLQVMVELAHQMTQLLATVGNAATIKSDVDRWNGFLTRTDRLSTALGDDSVAILRFKLRPRLTGPLNFEELFKRFEGFERLLHQSIPPHFPWIRVAGDFLLIACDRLMVELLRTRVESAIKTIWPMEAHCTSETFEVSDLIVTAKAVDASSESRLESN